VCDIIEWDRFGKMFDRLRAAWGNNRRLVSNFFSLSVLQFANYLAPLITVPYLVRVLGPEKFGLVAFANAFTQYLVTLSDYGFRWSATRKIAISRDDPDRRSRVFSSVMVIKFGFMILGLFLLVALLVLVPKFRDEWLLYVFAFGTVAGNVLFLDWFFQGMERMKYITLLNLISRGIFTAAVFVFIREPEQYVYVPLFGSLGAVTVGLASVWVVHRGFDTRFSVPGFSAVREELRDGWHVFLSVGTARIYTAGMPLILGCFAPYASVGYYTAGEKIVQAGTCILEPFMRAIYPHIGHLSSTCKESAVVLLRKIVRVIGPLTLLMSLGVALLAPQIAGLILGDQYVESIPVIRILALLFLAKGLGHIFLLQTMLNFGHERAVFRIVLAAALLCVVSSLVLIPSLSHRGAAVAALVPEVAMLVLSGSFVQKRYKLMDWHLSIRGTGDGDV
jgi:O-antigen/teichoic acid export membrane protein